MPREQAPRSRYFTIPREIDVLVKYLDMHEARAAAQHQLGITPQARASSSIRDLVCLEGEVKYRTRLQDLNGSKNRLS
jgi:hypothetical protein